MRPARGHRAFVAHHPSHPHRRSRLKTCTNILFTLCFLAVAGVWIFFITQKNSEILPHSLASLEILWETRTYGEDVCHVRLRHAGIILDSQEQGQRKNAESAATATAAASRHQLYRAMNASLSKGLQLGGGNNVQGKSVDDLFTRELNSGKLKPLLHPLQTPVRAIVLPVLETTLARSLQDAVIQHLVPLFPPNTLWLQNSDLLHSTIYHASTHMDPIPASQKQINSEILSILNVAERLCPIHATLESIVITHTGTILALWQPSPGSTEPLDLRNKLQQALPQASKKQVVTDKVLLHTTLARIATTSTTDGDDINNQMERQLEKGVEVLTQSPSLLPNKEALWAAVESITREFCGTQTRMDALWYVEEEDLLALALNGRVKKYTIPFQCSNTNFETF